MIHSCGPLLVQVVNPPLEGTQLASPQPSSNGSPAQNFTAAVNSTVGQSSRFDPLPGTDTPLVLLIQDTEVRIPG